MANNWFFFNDLKNTTVFKQDRNKQGDATSEREKVGNIEDVIVDLQTGEVMLYRLASGGFLGMGEDHYMLPARAISFGREGAVLQVGEHQVRQAPRITGSNPQPYDVAYINALHRHYGYQPLT